jgi:hypothetical protein
MSSKRIAAHPDAMRGKRGFVETPPDKFIGRGKASDVARKSGQSKVKNPLHSHNLK